MPDDSISEHLDVLAEDGSVIGQATRRDVHRRGLWHRTFHGLVVRSGLPARVVLQRRAVTSAFSGRLDFTASGHLEAGEQPTDGARELEEEIGLTVAAADLIPVGVHRIVDRRGDITNREQVHVFFIKSDVALQRFRPDPDEVASLVEIETNSLLSLVDQANPVTGIGAREWAPGAEVSDVTIELDDLMPGYENYVIKTMIMAERFAADRWPIAI